MTLRRKDFVICSRDIPRLEQCQAAGVYRYGEKRKMAYVQWAGIFLHRFIEYATTRGRDAALQYIRAKKMKKVIAVCELIDTDALPFGATEQSLAHNVFDDTARDALDGPSGCDIETDQFSKADLIDYSAEVPLVIDYKTGAEGDTLPADSAQLVGIAAAIRADTRAPIVRVGFGRIKATGEIDWTIQTLDGADLDAHVERARRIHLRVLEDRRMVDHGHEPDFVKGDLCQWCELRPVCPAHQ